MSKNSNKNGFILQAGILAAAGIFCRIIGLLYRSPLTAIIGDEGNGYYQTAYNVYTIILLISSYSIPSAISKVIAQKLSVKEYNNAHRIFKCSLYYVLVVGGIASLVLFFGAPVLTKGPAVNVLRIFAPTVFLYGILGVLRGYFQAHKTMVQTSVSQILEQILNAVVSILAAYLLISVVLSDTHTFVLNEDHSVTYGDEVVLETAPYIIEEDGTCIYQLTADQKEWNTRHATFGAIGSALGTGSGVVIALLFMFGIYRLNRKTILKKVQRDRHPVDGYGSILKTVSGVVVPFILSTAIYNLSTFLNQTIYTWICTLKKGMEVSDISTRYGIFSAKAVVISNIPIALASAMSSAILPTVSAKAGQGDMEGAAEKTAQAIKTTMIIAIPAAVGIGVLARPITWLLFNQKASINQASNLLTVLAVSVVFYSLSTLTNSILQGIGKVQIPVRNAAIALVLQTTAVSLMIAFTGLDLYALVLAMIMYSGAMCVLNQRSIRKYMGYVQEKKTTFFVPALSSALMGGAAFGVYKLLSLALGCGEYPSRIKTALTLFPAILVGGLIYFVAELLFKGITEEELRGFPKGHVLVKAAKKLHLLR